MSLPFADRPEESRVYQDLKELDLSQLTSTQFDALESSMKAQGTAGLEDEYRRLVLLKLASDQLFTSGPLNEASNVNITDTTGSGSPKGTVFQPSAGQVWQFMGASTSTLNATRCDISLTDGTIEVIIGSEGTASTPFDPDGTPPIYVTNDVYMGYQMVSATGNCTIRASFIRIR